MTERVVAKVLCPAGHLLAQVVDGDAGGEVRVWKVQPRTVDDEGGAWLTGRDSERVDGVYRVSAMPPHVFASCRCSGHSDHTIDTGRLLDAVARSNRRVLALGVSEVRRSL